MTRSVFLFAHPDDEFGCYESIRLEAASGRRVECYYLTDGGFGGQAIELRESETLCVLSRLGVQEGAVHFMGRRDGIPDGKLPEHMIRAEKELTDHLMHHGDVATMYAPAWEGGHQDHDAAHLVACVVNEKVKAADGLWQFSLYHGAGLRGGFFHVLKPMVSNGPLKKQVVPLKYRILYLRFCLSYPSQWKTWVGLFPFVVFKLLFNGCYYVQSAELAKVTPRPHDGFLLYERRGMAYFSDFERNMYELLGHYCAKV